MVIGDRFIFVQNPRCASSQMGRELWEYGGEQTLRKHSDLDELPLCYRSRFSFSFVRNPLDKLVTMYLRGKFQEKHALAKNSFTEFCRGVLAQYGKDYDVGLNTDFIGRYENLQVDFHKALLLIGLEQQRPLPWEFRTRNKRHFLTYFDEDSIPLAKKYCGEQMELLGYSFPEEW